MTFAEAQKVRSALMTGERVLTSQLVAVSVFFNLRRLVWCLQSASTS